jgi:hypothetical protein
VFDEPKQTVGPPKIVPGVAGAVFTVIARVEEAEDPHELFAVTLILPLVALAVVVIELVVDVPVQPPGNVHV